MDPNEEGELLPEPDPRILTMVAGLHNQLTDLEEKYNKSLLENAELKDLLKSGKADSADIYYFLQKKLDDNYNNINELECQIIKEQSDRELAELDYEKKIRELESLYANEKESNEKKINELEEKLLSLNEFQERREHIEKSLKKEMEVCQSTKENAAKKLLEMEKKCIRDKEEIRKEMLAKIQETKANLIDASQDRLDEITKETMLENDQLRMEIRLQARESEKIMQHSSRVEKENKDLKCLLDLARATELELMRRMSTYGKVARKLQTSLSNQHRQQRLLLESRQQQQSEQEQQEQEQYKQKEHQPYFNEEGKMKDDHEEAKEAEGEETLDDKSYDTMQSASLLEMDSITNFGNEKLSDIGEPRGDHVETSTTITRVSTITKSPSTVSLISNPLPNGQRHFKEGKTYPSNWIGSLSSENRSVLSSDTTIVGGAGISTKQGSSSNNSHSNSTTTPMSPVIERNNVNKSISKCNSLSKGHYSLSKRAKAELNAAGKIRLGGTPIPKQNSV